VSAKSALLVLALLSGLPAQAQFRPDAALLRMPDVSRDQIAFRYDGDVWVVDKRGGVARRLTSAEGNESFPRFSPDGKSLAFMGGYEGGSDLYVIELAGGLPRRLTHHPDSEMLCGWLPGGEGLLFYSSQNSGQRRAPKLFTVATEGGQPLELPVPYGTFGGIDAGGRRLAYTPDVHSEFSTWRRYQGGMAQDVWLFDLASHESKRLTDWPGDDALPMWHGDEVYFVSDRAGDGRANLWSVDVESGAFTQRTRFAEFDVRFPSVGPDDIVFENGGKLWRYEFAAGDSVAVEVFLPGDRPRLLPRTHDVADLVREVDLGPSAKRVVLEARGELFSVPVEEGLTRNLTASDGSAERDPAWSPDGRWIAYVSDESGEYEVWVRRSDGRRFRWNDAGDEVAAQRLTSLGAGWKSDLSWAPDSKSLVFATNDGALRHLTLADGALRTLATNPDGEPLEVDWSPDSRWLAWSQRHSRSRLPAIQLYDLASSTAHEVTAGFSGDDEPCFDRNGEWLYYRSMRRFTPTYGDEGYTWIYSDTQVVVAVPLRAEVENPFAASTAEEFEDEDAETSDAEEQDEQEKPAAEVAKADGEQEPDAKSGAAAEDDEKTGDEDEAPEPVEIELAGFEARGIVLPIARGPIRELSAAKGKLLYLRSERGGTASDDEEGPSFGKLVMFEIGAKAQERKEKTIVEGVHAYMLARRAEKLVVAGGPEGKLHAIDLAPDQKLEEPIDLGGLSTTVDPRREWAQMVRDAARLQRDFFYEPTLHGVDWERIVARTLASLEDATSRDDVHTLLADMISELNVGHAYNQGPPDGLQRAEDARPIGLLGCDWTLERGAYRIARILRGEPSDLEGRGPLGEPGVDAREGDWLLAVDGVPVDASRDVYAAFEGLAERTVELTLHSAPTFDGGERRVVVVPMRSERELRYRDWVAAKRAEVARLSEGRVGYVHVPDTGVRGQNELVRQFLGQMHCDALLVDERWNGGGQIPTRFIELLDRPVTNYWAVRHGQDWAWPPVAHFGPKAMLVNHASGSGGDAFPYYFRQRGLGKLIGTRTWGGLVGISGNPELVDGASVTVPRFAFYELDGTWGVEGHGVDPDIEVLDDPARMQGGRDPQLEAGVTHLLEELREGAHVRPPRPANPDRSGVGITPADH
jgi:tricorn protease